MADINRPRPFTESERGKIERIKRLKAAEREERLRFETQELWKQ